MRGRRNRGSEGGGEGGGSVRGEGGKGGKEVEGERVVGTVEGLSERREGRDPVKRTKRTIGERKKTTLTNVRRRRMRRSFSLIFSFFSRIEKFRSRKTHARGGKRRRGRSGSTRGARRSP